jgi:hypothetical protein
VKLFFERQGAAAGDDSMYETVEKILFGVGFIAVAGVVALMFFFIFAPSILGSKTIHRQLEKLQQEAERMNEQLRRIAEHLENEERQPRKKSQGE